MKRHFTFLMAAFALMVCMIMPLGMRGQTRTVQQLTNANIVSAGNAASGYQSWTIADNNNNTWNAYAIKNQHSNATSGYHYLQIKKYASSTAYYIQVPELGTKITSITMTVSSTSLPMNGGGNTATLYFSNSNSTSATGFGVASGTGGSSVTIDCSSLNLNTGYITASSGVRIWDVSVTYTSSGDTTYTVTLADDNTTLTQASPGASVTLPSRSDIDAYAFAGWSETNVDVETTTAPTIIPAGSYTPTTDITLYPVYTRTESGGTTTEWRLTNLNAADAGVYALLTTDGHAFNGTISKGHGQITDDAFSFTDNVAAIAPTGVCEITFVSVTGGFKMHNADKGYLYASAASSGSLAWQNSENSYWFYGSSNWKYNSNSAYLRSYSNNSIRTYGNNNGDVLKLAKKVEVTGVTTYYWSNLGTFPIINVAIPDVLAYNATSGAISYTITNPVTGTSLVPTVLAGGDWISNVNVTTSQVTFDVSTNTTNSDRTGSIKLSYQGAQDKTVTITQGHLTVNPPTFTPEAGTYTTPKNVTISCTTSDATIYYTTDGSTPNTSSSVYSSAIPVSSNTTIKAIAVKEGVNSEVATASYVFVNPAEKTATYTITSTNIVSAAGTVPSGSSASFVNTYTNMFQLTADNSMTLTLSGYQGKVVTGVVLSMKSNKSSGAGSLSITAGSSSLASISGNFKPNWYSEWTTEFVDVNVPMTDDDYGIQSGEQLVITISATTNSLYCQSFTIQYEDDVNPRIIVTAPDTLAYDATSGAFNYSISNPVQGTSLQASSNADWISDIQVGDAQVTFTTTVNDTYLERNDTITLTYGTVTKAVIITQAALVPAITISDAPTDAFSYEGDYGSFSFSIDHLVDGAIATAYSAEYWIRNFEVSDDMVYFEVAPSIEDARSGNITLSYMLNGATLASVTVPINQETNPNDPGTFERPYSVTEAWTIINGMADGVTADNSVYVAGTISQIEQVEVIQYHNAIYKITDGNKTLYVRYGRNLDDTDFYDEDEIQEGDRVVICGKLQKHSSSPKYRIAEYNYLVSLERDVEPPLFLPTSCMMANDEYAVVELYTNNEEEVVIYYTTNGNTPTNSSEIYNDDTGISLQGITDEVTIKAVAYTLDGTKHSAVNSETYRMVSPNTHGLFNHPFTVQQALDSLEVSATIEGVYVRGVVCADPEFSLSNFMNANYYIADNLGDENQLYVFRGRYYYGEAFSNQEQLQYGDIVTVFGDLTIYGQVKEFTARNYIVDLVRPSSIFIRPSEVTTNCRGISSSLNVYYNNLTHINSSELLFCDAQGNQVPTSTYDWLIANWNLSTGNIDFQIEDNDSNAPRTAYLKLVVVDAGSPTPLVSNVVPITQGICSASDFATLPFHYVGNESEVPAGITSDGLNENYGSSPYLKFDGVNDYMTLAFNEVPGELTFDIKGDNFKSSEFYLQTSTNNLDWDDLAIYTTQEMINSWDANNPKRDIAIVIGNPMAQSFPQLDANVRYIRWIMMTHSSGSKVRLGNIHLAKPLSPCTYAYSVNGTIGEPNEVVVGTVIEQMPSSDNIVFNNQTFYFRGWTTDANDVTNLIRANSSYTIRQDVTFHAVYYQQVTSTEAEKHYAKVTNELSDWSGDYLIVYDYEDGNVAFNGALETLDAANNTVAVTISNGIINATETMNAAKFTIAAVDDGYSIKSASGKYIGKNADGNGLDEDETTAYKNSISYNEDNGEIDIIGEGGAYLRFNKTSGQNRFRYFKSATYGSQQPIQLYKYVGSVNNLYTRIFMNETADNITIEGPSIIPDGSVLEVTTITNNLGADRLLVDEGGQLVTSSDVNATVRKTITPYAEEHGTDNYYLIASPVDNLNPTTAGMTVDNFDLYAFDQSAHEEWRNYEADNFNLAAGQGYLYANDYGGFINMGGTMAATADDVTIEHVAGKDLAGWNLIGNPYPCNVTIGKPYYRLAEDGAALAMDATAESVALAPMEGAFVYADSEEEEVSFTKAPTTSTTGRGGNTLSLRVSRNRDTKDGSIVEDNAIIRFGEGSLLRKLVLNPDLPQIYVAQDGADYAIVNAEAEGELPISFRAAENGSYTISVNAEEVSFGYLHLIDNKTGVNVDLLQTNNYTFDANTADYACRFKLVFATNSICEDTDGGNETFSYFNGSAWVVNGVDAGAILQVVDMTGRVILSNDAKAGVAANAMSQGIYVLRLIDGDNVKIQKIINK